MKRFALFFSYQILAVAVIILLFEGFLRLTGYAPSTIVTAMFYKNLSGDFEPNIRIKSEMPKLYPYIFTTNSQGIRRLQEMKPGKEPGVFRVLCLGDSNTMGWGVADNETFAARLENKLAQKFPNRHFEVINGGNLFSNVLDNIDYYREKGRKLAPDLIVFQSCYNDIDTDLRRNVVGRVAMRLDADHDYVPSTFSVLSLFKNSATMHALAMVKYAMSSSHSFENRVKGGNIDGTIVPQEVLKAARQNDHNDFLLTPTAEEVKAMENFGVVDVENVNILHRFWESYEKAILLLKKEVEADGAAFVFISLPCEKQLVDYRNGQEYVYSSFAAKNGISYVDFTKVLRSLIRRDPLEYHLKADGHLNAKGHDVVAETILIGLTLRQGDEGKADVTFASDYLVRDYAHPEVLSLGIDSGNKTLIPLPSSDLSFFKDMKINCDKAATWDYPKPDKPYHVSFLYPQDRRDAVCTIAFTTTEATRQLDIVTFRRAMYQPDRTSGVRLSLRVDDAPPRTLYDYATDGTSWKEDFFEQIKMSTLSFPDGGTRFTARLDMTGEGGLVVDDPREPGASRRFLIVAYPSQVD